MRFIIIINYMNAIKLVLFIRESGMDIFSATFQTILDGITPTILQRMQDGTILLLLELCFSYFNQSEISFQ